MERVTVAFALGLATVLAVGCGDDDSGPSGNGGSGGTAGSGGPGATGGAGGPGGIGGGMGQEFPCTEQGIRDAATLGGGPHTFACEGPTRVEIEGETILLETDVVLDGSGNLVVRPPLNDNAFKVGDLAKVELRNLWLAGGDATGTPLERSAGAIVNEGVLTLRNVVITDNTCRMACGEAVGNTGRLTMIDTVVGGNPGKAALSLPDGVVVSVNSTLSGDIELFNDASLEFTNTTVVGDIEYGDGGGRLTRSLIVGQCVGPRFLLSDGHNIESPGATCVSSDGDQTGVPIEDLRLGPLRDNGGDTLTHALGEGSVAIDVIPVAECVDQTGQPLTTDQRGFPRPGGAMCDVGAFEVQP